MDLKLLKLAQQSIKKSLEERALNQQAPQAAEANKAIMNVSGRLLRAGGDKIPMVEFIGTGLSWDVRPSPFDNNNDMFIDFNFNQVQVIKMRDDAGPYPHDVVTLPIKHSAALRSGFGFVQGSINEALGIPQDQSELDSFIGKSWHVTASQFNWGHIPNSQVADANGDTWGEIWTFALASGQAVQFQTQVPASVQVTSTPPSNGDYTASGPVNNEEILFGLLQGKNLADFNAAVVGDGRIQQDPPLFISVMNNAWMAAHKLSGKVVENADGTHTVN